VHSYTANSSGAIQMEMTQYTVVTTSLGQMMEWELGRLGQEGMRGKLHVLDDTGRTDLNIDSGQG